MGAEEGASVGDIVAVERTVSPVEAGPDLFGDGRADRPDLAARLAAWAARARVDEAAADRSRESFLRRAATEDATIAGVLVDLAERGGTVLAVTTAGRRHRGPLRAVGHDFVVLRTDTGRDVLVAMAGLASVRPEAGAPATSGGRGVTVPAGLAEALALLAEERPRVLVVPTGGDGVAGELRAVGRDVVTIAPDGSERGLAYVPMTAITEVTLA